MRFILFNICEIDKTKIQDIIIEQNKIIKQIIISKNDISKLMDDKKGFFKSVAIRRIERNFKKVINKALEKYNSKWYYFLSKNFSVEQKDFLKIKFEEFLGYEYTPLNEMNSNIFKYVDDFVKDSNMKTQDIKLLLVCNDSSSLNLSFVKELLNEYKNVDIYIKEKVSSYILKQIKNINKNFGTTTEILKNDKKSFKEYNVIYFVNSYKKDYNRLRFNKNSLFIDNEIVYNDKYNSNNIFLDNYIKLFKDESIISETIKTYGKLETAISIKNIT